MTEIPCERRETLRSRRGEPWVPHLPCSPGRGFLWDVRMTSCSFCLTPTRFFPPRSPGSNQGITSVPVSLHLPSQQPWRGNPLSASSSPGPGGRLSSPGAPSPVTSSSRASLGRALTWGFPLLWYSQVYSPASLDFTSGRWNSARSSVESGDWTISQTRAPFLRAKLTSLVGVLHHRVTEVPAGTTELGQALREGLGSASGRKPVSGLGAPHPPALRKPMEGRGKWVPLGGRIRRAYGESLTSSSSVCLADTQPCRE